MPSKMLKSYSVNIHPDIKKQTESICALKGITATSLINSLLAEVIKGAIEVVEPGANYQERINYTNVDSDADLFRQLLVPLVYKKI
jgi:hypothetical protein